MRVCYRALELPGGTPWECATGHLSTPPGGSPWECVTGLLSYQVGHHGGVLQAS